MSNHYLPLGISVGILLASAGMTWTIRSQWPFTAIVLVMTIVVAVLTFSIP